MRSRWLWGPAALAVLVRLALWGGGGLWAQAGSDLRLDPVEYHGLAVSLAEGRGWAFEAPDGFVPRYDVAALRTPGYPAFVAAVYALFGPRPGWVLLLQVLLDGATCLLLAQTLRPRLGDRGAGVAALVVALHPAAALYSVILLSESLFVFLLVGAVALVWGPWREPAPPASGASVTGPRRARWCAAGVLLGLSVLVKPLALWLLPLLALGALWTHRRAPGRVASSAVLVAAAALVVAPWVARNAAVLGEATLSTSSAYNALALYAAPVHARATGTSEAEARNALFDQADLRARDAGLPTRAAADAQRSPFWQAEAVETVKRYPLTAARLEAVGIVRQFASIGRVSRQHVFGEREAEPRGPGLGGAVRWWAAEPLRDKALDLWALLYALVAYPLVGWGVVRAIRERAGGVVLVSGLVAAFLIVSTGIPGYSRFLVPAVPFLGAFAGLALRVLPPRPSRGAPRGGERESPAHRSSVRSG